MWKKKSTNFTKKPIEPPPSLDFEAALLKMESFCAYQERCEQEVTQRLKLLKVGSDIIENVIDRLIETNFLNEERFALAYARGKFRISSWGRIRIRQELQARRISKSLIEKALEEMTTDESYEQILEDLLLQKAHKYDQSDPQRLEKIAGHALRRGFESGVVWASVKKIFS